MGLGVWTIYPSSPPQREYMYLRTYMYLPPSRAPKPPLALPLTSHLSPHLSPLTPHPSSLTLHLANTTNYPSPGQTKE